MVGHQHDGPFGWDRMGAGGVDLPRDVDRLHGAAREGERGIAAQIDRVGVDAIEFGETEGVFNQPARDPDPDAHEGVGDFAGLDFEHPVIGISLHDVTQERVR